MVLEASYCASERAKRSRRSSASCVSMPIVLLPFPDFFAFEQAANLRREAIRVEGFAEEAVKARFLGTSHLVFTGFGGHCTDDGVAQTWVGAQFLQRLVAIFVRQANVHQNQVDAGQRVGKLYD